MNKACVVCASICLGLFRGLSCLVWWMWHVRGELDVGQCCQKYVGASQCLWLGGLSRARRCGAQGWALGSWSLSLLWPCWGSWAWYGILACAGVPRVWPGSLKLGLAAVGGRNLRLSAFWDYKQRSQELCPPRTHGRPPSRDCFRALKSQGSDSWLFFFFFPLLLPCNFMNFLWHKVNEK